MAAPVISLPLTYIFNLSFTQGKFPNILKLAKVIPIHKANSKLITSNYRPISVLPVFSKILEKLMHKRLMSFIVKFKLLFKYQFAFQQNRSTEQAF